MKLTDKIKNMGNCAYSIGKVVLAPVAGLLPNDIRKEIDYKLNTNYLNGVGNFSSSFLEAGIVGKYAAEALNKSLLNNPDPTEFIHYLAIGATFWVVDIAIRGGMLKGESDGISDSGISGSILTEVPYRFGKATYNGIQNLKEKIKKSN